MTLIIILNNYSHKLFNYNLSSIYLKRTIYLSPYHNFCLATSLPICAKKYSKRESDYTKIHIGNASRKYAFPHDTAQIRTEREREKEKENREKSTTPSSNPPPSISLESLLFDRVFLKPWVFAVVLPELLCGPLWLLARGSRPVSGPLDLPWALFASADPLQAYAVK